MSEITNKTFFPDAPIPALFEEKVFEKVKNDLSAQEKDYFLKQVLPALRERPKTEQFSYPESEKQQDAEALRNKQARAEIDAGYIKAKICEHILAGMVELNNWLGERTMITETSEADDWLNGVDSVAEFGEENGLRLAIDFTTEVDPEKMKQKKTLPIYLGIEQGRLTAVKYFISQLDKQARKLRLLPKVLIALSGETIKSLIVRKPSELENHWVKTAILFELREQLRFFWGYINKPTRPGYNSDNVEQMTLKYQPLLTKIENLTNETVQIQRDRFEKIKTPRPVDEAVFEKLLLQELSQRDRSFAALLRTLS